MDREHGIFLWDIDKEQINLLKHGIDFITAARVFSDPQRKIFKDSQHSLEEERLFCIGKIDEQIITVRFSYRDFRIRIIGAGSWRKGRKYYEKTNQ